MIEVTVAAAVVAVVAAVRSTWSPCALSMLSSITPLGEAGRGHRFRPTATWFVAGAILGGSTLGLVCAGLAAALRATGFSTPTLIGLAGLACAAAGAWDLDLLGVPMPVIRRQVNELWLDQFRSWVYGAGFGWQIGVGYTTYVMTAGVFALVAVAGATTAPWVAFAVGTSFGTMRGIAVLLGRNITSPADLARVHRRLAGWRRPAQLAVAYALLAVAAGLGVGSSPVVIGLALAVGAAGAVRAFRKSKRSELPEGFAAAGSVVDSRP